MYMNASDLTEFNNNGQPYLPPAQVMRPGDYLLSPDKSYKLIFQENTDLCLWKDGKMIWAANGDTPNSTDVYSQDEVRNYPVQNVAMMYTSLQVIDTNRNRVWYSKGSYLPWSRGVHLRNYAVLQDDGNVVVNRYTELFMSDLNNLMYPDDANVVFLAPGQVIQRNTIFKAGSFTYAFQDDSNFVIYNAAGSPIWNSQTHGSNADRLVMQEDGNLVMYRGYDAVWHTSTGGNPGAYAALQSNGNLVIFDTKLMWARFGFTPTAAPPRKKFKGGSTNLGTGVQDSLNPIKFPSYTTWTWNF